MVRVQAISRDGFTHEMIVPLEQVHDLACRNPRGPATATDVPAAAHVPAAGFQIGTDLPRGRAGACPTARPGGRAAPAAIRAGKSASSATTWT